MFGRGFERFILNLDETRIKFDFTSSIQNQKYLEGGLLRHRSNLFNSKFLFRSKFWSENNNHKLMMGPRIFEKFGQKLNGCNKIDFWAQF